MSNAHIVAWLLGPLYIAVGLGVLVDREFYLRVVRDVLQNEALVYVTGAIALVAGIAIVLASNLWVADWRVIITVTGWLSILKGAARMIFPTATRGIGTRIVENRGFMTAAGVGCLALGGLLVWMAATG